MENQLFALHRPLHFVLTWQDNYQYSSIIKFDTKMERERRQLGLKNEATN